MQVGAGFINRNHQVLDDIYAIVNSCDFAVDVTMERGQVETIAAGGAFCQAAPLA